MTVVMPLAAVQAKVDACREYGAEVVLHGTHVGESLEHLQRLREERGLVLVHPYDDPEVLLGNGSCGLELLEDLPDVDVVVIAVGGGGLIGGVTVALCESRPGIRVYGVEPTGSDALNQALAAGESGPRHAGQRRRRAQRAVRGPPGARRRAPLPRGQRHDRRRDDPRGAAVRARAHEAGGRAGRGDGARGRPVRGDPAARGRSRRGRALRGQRRDSTGSASSWPLPPDGRASRRHRTDATARRAAAPAASAAASRAAAPGVRVRRSSPRRPSSRRSAKRCSRSRSGRGT